MPRFILICFAEKCLGPDQIPGKINFTPKVPGHCARTHQLLGGQGIHYGEIPAIKPCRVPKRILDRAAEQLRPVLTKKDKTDGLAVDLIGGQVLAYALDPSIPIQLHLHVVRIVAGFVAHAESNGSGGGVQHLYQ